MPQPDGRGISRNVADQRYSQPAGLRALSALPFNHSSGVTTDDGANAVFKDLTYFNSFILTEGTDHVVIEYDNFHTNTASGETTNGKITIAASLQIRSSPSLSTHWGPFRATFNGGSTSLVLEPRTRIRTDVLLTGFLPAGTEIRIATYVQAATGLNYPVGRPAAWGSVGYQAGDQTGNLAPTLTSYAGYAPCGLYHYGDQETGLALMGDSRIFGTGETTGLTGGWAARRCYEVNIGTVIAAKSGEKIQDWIANYSYRQNRLSLCGDMPYALLGWGINDLSAGRTYAQLVADFNTLIGWLYQSGTKCYIPTIFPYTQSSDSWATAANQSRSASFSAQAEADRQAFNTLLRNPSAAQAAFGPGYAGCIEVAALIEVDANNVLTLNGGRYYATGGTGAAATTTDGLHANTLGNTMMMPAITPAIANTIRKGTPPPRISQLLAPVA